MAISVRRSFGIGADALAAASRAALDVPLADEAELWLARPSEDATVLGAFQRAVDPAPGRLVRRGSGGPSVRIGEGTLWLALLLPRVDALVDCDEARLVNRYVRPLLRALTRTGALAHFFGRDWVSVKRRPATWVGFAHDATTGRAVIEAFVARSTRFDAGARASFLGKEPGTLEEIAGAPVDEARLADAIVAAYAEAYGRVAIDRGAIDRGAIERGVSRSADDSDAARPPHPSGSPPRRQGGESVRWLATIEEAIGELGAGPDESGRFRIGGDLLVSRDALAELEERVAREPGGDIGAMVDATLGAPHVALDGVKSLASVRDVIARALAQRR